MSSGCQHDRRALSEKDFNSLQRKLSKFNVVCRKCKDNSDLWLCLDCLFIGCGGMIRHIHSHHETMPTHNFFGKIEQTPTIRCFSCGLDYSQSFIDAHPFFSQMVRIITFTFDILQSQIESSNPLEEPILLRPFSLVGMTNLGNNCYMNVILQVLSHVRPLRDFYLSHRHSLPFEKLQKLHYDYAVSTGSVEDPHAKRSSRGNVSLSSYSSVAEEFTKLVDQLWREVKPLQFIAPCSLFQSINRVNPLWGLGQQQDAQEFFRYIIDIMHAELAAVTENTSLGDSLVRSYSETVLTRLFQGVLRSEVVCTVCGTASVKSELFYDLSLEIPLTKIRVERDDEHPDSYWPVSYSIDDCFENFSNEELLTRDNKYNCDSCGIHQDARKHLRLTQLPTFLCIHIKRFHINPIDYNREKIDTWIFFDEGLDVKNYCHDAVEIEDLTESPVKFKIKKMDIDDPQGSDSPKTNPQGCPHVGADPQGSASIETFLQGSASAEADHQWSSDVVADIQKSDGFFSNVCGDTAVLSKDIFEDTIGRGETVMESSNEFLKYETVMEDETVMKDETVMEDETAKEDETVMKDETVKEEETVMEDETDELKNDSKNRIFDLIAVVEHIGADLMKGHYVCHMRGQNGGWNTYNDDVVTAISFEQVQQSQAYLLFYQRRNILPDFSDFGSETEIIIDDTLSPPLGVRVSPGVHGGVPGVGDDYKRIQKSSYDMRTMGAWLEDDDSSSQRKNPKKKKIKPKNIGANVGANVGSNCGIKAAKNGRFKKQVDVMVPQWNDKFHVPIGVELDLTGLEIDDFSNIKTDDIVVTVDENNSEININETVVTDNIKDTEKDISKDTEKDISKDTEKDISKDTEKDISKDTEKDI
eukprot:GHVL01026427.1.p1 GENE.GHVL01026427.1~~GHVL01026427.1.p1  ORF type:complete len:869 (-),score=197.56 GHVL01026427.1:33-2639(-)